jgi:imidazole glycerol phosphate synthase subunit HisF
MTAPRRAGDHVVCGLARPGARRLKPAHPKEAFDAGADAVLAASIFHDDEPTVGEVKRALAALGVQVRR